MSGSASFSESKSTVARSEERFTTAEFTPFNFLRLRSTVATQFAQVMPVIGSVSCLVLDIFFLLILIQWMVNLAYYKRFRIFLKHSQARTRTEIKLFAFINGRGKVC